MALLISAAQSLSDWLFLTYKITLQIDPHDVRFNVPFKDLVSEQVELYCYACGFL